MIVKIPCTQLLNEKTLRKEKNFMAMTEFRRALADRKMNVRDRLVVDFRTDPGRITVSSYPPVMWTRNMMTMSFRNLDDPEYKAYVNMRDQYRRTGGMKVREWSEKEGRVVTRDLLPSKSEVESQITKSGIILQP